MQRKIARPDLHGLTLVVGTTAWLAGMLLDAWALLPSLALLIGSIAALLCILALWRNGAAAARHLEVHTVQHPLGERCGELLGVRRDGPL